MNKWREKLTCYRISPFYKIRHLLRHHVCVHSPVYCRLLPPPSASNNILVDFQEISHGPTTTVGQFDFVLYNFEWLIKSSMLAAWNEIAVFEHSSYFTLWLNTLDFFKNAFVSKNNFRTILDTTTKNVLHITRFPYYRKRLLQFDMWRRLVPLL